MSDPQPPSVHRIRLQGPWEWAVPTPLSTQAWTWSRIRLPDEWESLPAMSGPIWFRRRFNTPTGITPTDQIRLVILANQQPVTVILNGQEMPVLAPRAGDESFSIRFEMTPSLAERNLLEIVFAKGVLPSHLRGGLCQPVVLEIDSMATVR